MKQFFISFLVAILLSALQPNLSKAQTPGTAHINRQLRQLFVNLKRPPNPKEFLYDMSVHFLDSSLYTTKCPDTIGQDIWYKLYEEMYHSAYDTTKLEHPDSIFYRAHGYNKDTIPVGIMSYAFYKFKANALTTNTYFDFDTINNVSVHYVDCFCHRFLSSVILHTSVCRCNRVLKIVDKKIGASLPLAGQCFASSA